MIAQDDQLRDAAVAALLRLAESDRYEDRGDAGVGLALFLDRPQVTEAVAKLVLDERDTFVTMRASEALLRRHDVDGLRVVVRALGQADDNHADLIGQAVGDVLGIREDELLVAKVSCMRLLDDADKVVQVGTRRLMHLLVEIQPVLRPAT